ncbi:MAG: cytochrome c [Sulfurovum sp.]|nr:MAG: cytochrome c [Sulfurovum sp.]
MRKIIKILSVGMVVFITSSSLYATSGKKVFETYCWGCHHQTAEAFGPSFEEIASKRRAEEIQAMITDPVSVSKLFGYKRNAMPSFTLSEENLTSITKYILSYKPNIEVNITKESNETIPSKPQAEPKEDK